MSIVDPTQTVQTTLHDYGLTPASLLEPQTEPATYLHTNDVPVTEPTYIADTPPAPVREAAPSITPRGTQATLSRWLTDACPYCDTYPENREKHLLEQHPAEVSDFISNLATKNTPTSTPDVETEDSALEPQGPVMYGEIPVDTPGHSLEPGDHRACNECGTRKSARYASVFGHEDGTLYCPDCKPRSERYTNDPTYGDNHDSNPGSITGSSNPRSDANDVYAEPS